MRVLEHSTGSTAAGAPVFVDLRGHNQYLPVFLQREFEANTSAETWAKWTNGRKLGLSSNALRNSARPASLRVSLVPFHPEIAGPRQIEAVFTEKSTESRTPTRRNSATTTPTNSSSKDVLNGQEELPGSGETLGTSTPAVQIIHQAGVASSDAGKACGISPLRKFHTGPPGPSKKRTLSYYSPTACVHSPRSGHTTCNRSAPLLTRKRLREHATSMARLRGITPTTSPEKTCNKLPSIEFDVEHVHGGSLEDQFENTASKLNFT